MRPTLASLSPSLRRPALLAGFAILSGIVAAAGCGGGATTTNSTGFGGNTSSATTTSTGMGGILFETSSTSVTGSTDSSTSTGTGTDPGAPCKGTASTGAAQWAHNYGDAGGQYALAVATDASGNVLVTGQFTGTLTFGGLPALSATNKSIFVAKLGPDGTPKWAKKFEPVPSGLSATPPIAAGRAIVADSAGNVYVAGDFLGSISFGPTSVRSTGRFFADAFVAKLDVTGNPAWISRLGEPQPEGSPISMYDGGVQIVRSIAIRKGATGDQIAVVGEFQDQIKLASKTLMATGSNAAYVAVFGTLDGTNVLAASFGDGAVEQSGRAIALDKNGDILVAGRTAGAITFPGGSAMTPVGAQGAFVAKIKSDLSATTWAKLYGSDKASGEGIAVDGSGNVYVTGDHSGTIDFGGAMLDNKFGANVFVAKLDGAGKHVYSHTFGDSLAQHAHGIALDAMGRAVVTGQYSGSIDFGGGPLMSGGGDDIFVARIDAQGCQVWAQRFGDAALQTANAVATDAMGNAVIAGNIGGVVDFGTGALTAAGDDVFVAKFAP